MKPLGNDWDTILAAEFASEYYTQLRVFLYKEYTGRHTLPPAVDIYNALRFTSYEETKAVIVGQDPYPTPGHAHGLAFSVRQGVRVPPSLVNIFKEMAQDTGCQIPTHGCLESWARQGVLLLNTVLTVQAHKPRSHAGRGWEQLTDAILTALNHREKPAAFLLWGNDAQKKSVLINAPQHLVLKAAHPSPLAMGRFFGCKHFSQVNTFLSDNGMEEIKWN